MSDAQFTAPPLTSAADILFHNSQEDFCRDRHFGAIDLMGDLACSEKIAVKMECVAGVLFSLHRAPGDWGRAQAGMSSPLPCPPPWLSSLSEN